MAVYKRNSSGKYVKSKKATKKFNKNLSKRIKSKSHHGSSSKNNYSVVSTLDSYGNVTTKETKNNVTTTSYHNKSTGKSSSSKGNLSGSQLTALKNKTIISKPKKSNLALELTKQANRELKYTPRAKIVRLSDGKVIQKLYNPKVNGFDRRITESKRKALDKRVRQELKPNILKYKFNNVYRGNKGSILTYKKPQERTKLNLNDKTWKNFKKKYYPLEFSDTKIKKLKWYEGNSQLKKLNSWLNTNRKEAIKKKSYATASLLGVASLPTNLVQAFSDIIIETADFLKEAATNPKKLTKDISSITLKDINRAGRNLGISIQSGDPYVPARVAAEILTFKFGMDLGLGKQIGKLSPYYKPLKNGKYIIRKPKLKIFNSVEEFLHTKINPFKKFTKDPGLVLKVQTVESGATSLSKQAELAGQEITAVTALREQLTSWLKRKKLIRKPIPGEENFPKSIKSLVDKLDSGVRLTDKEFTRVNLYLQKHVAPNITLLERSLYADPASGLRVSRLGSKERAATLSDILKGNFKLRASKPQVLIFENAKVARFPKRLKSIEAKLKKGLKLTVDETNKLIRWQTETGSGKFKPIGSTIFKGGKELEVTLAPGEYIKRLKKVGYTYVDGKKVTFVTAEVWKPEKNILKKLIDAKNGKFSLKEVEDLEKSLSKKLKNKIEIESPYLRERRIVNTKPVLRVKGKYINIFTRKPSTRKPSTRKPSTRKPSTRKPSTRKPSTRKPSTRKPSTRKPSTRKPSTRKPSTRKPSTRKPSTRKPSTRKPSTRKPSTRKPSTRKPSTRKPSTRKPSTRKPSTRKPTVKKPTVKKPTPKKKEPKKPYRTKSKPKSKPHPLGLITYKIGKKTKTIRTNLPYNKALKLAKETLDNTLLASMTIKPYGKTKIKDIKKPNMSKFRLKKGKNPLVQQIVEKRKFRLDTKGETHEIKITKFIKDKIKRYNRK